MNGIEAFRVAMRAAGLEYAGPIVDDGRLHRVKVCGDHNRNSWYVLHAGSPAAASFGCWKRELRETWCERNGQLSQAEWNGVRRHWQDAERERERADKERREKARKDAEWILKHSKPVTAHGYLTAKGVQPHGGLRQRGGLLVLPLLDSAGTLQSLQFIAPDKRFDGERNKTFLGGGRVAGCFFTVADRADGALVICEGYATGASIHEATGFAVVCAMNCGNLLAVSKALREKFPAREIVVAADDDRWKPEIGNPGLTKATEAAKAIGARLAVPQFKDTATRLTDFNDLHQLQGAKPVKTQIESAITPKETDTETFDRLAKLSPADYDRCRDDEAKQLNIRTATLDTEVQKRRAKSGESLQGGALNLADVELWPDAVNGADILAGLAETFSRYIALPAGAADALALWTAHTHSFECFQCSPRLNISSPEKRCGKTTLRDVLALFVARPLLTENLSVAVLFRVIELHKPTVLADECDGWLKDNEDLRSMLNSGHRRGGKVFRCEGDGHEVRGFQVFAPAVLCGIGSLPGTLYDRSIVIRLERAKSGEVRERFDSRHTEGEHELCRKLARFVADNRTRIESCDPNLPDSAFNRLADNWRPLFAIAEIAGDDWPQRAAAAFAKLTDKTDADAQGIGAMLLADIAGTFAAVGADKLPSIEITDALAKIEGREWAEWGRTRKPITPNQLAKLLRRFNVSPRTIKLPDGSTAKGYHRDMFDEAFERYLPQSLSPKRNPVTMPENIGDFALPETSLAKDGLRVENDEIANKDAEGDAVTVQKAGKPESEALLL